MVTRRGTNQFRGDLFTYWMPERLQEHEPDTHSGRGPEETLSNSSSGPRSEGTCAIGCSSFCLRDTWETGIPS